MSLRSIATSAIMLATLLLVLVLVEPVAAQPDTRWRERATDYFSILYVPGSEVEAERYALWVDEIYEDLATLFGHRTATPLALRLFPTSDSYYEANPAARNVPGVVAHADFRRRELVVIIERTAQQSEEEVRNNVRHELTHIIASDLSDNRLNTGFHEGIAQYLELPTGALERNVAALRRARDQGLLLPWSAFDDRDRIYGQPEVSYPQSLAVVAFLADRGGFAKLREFLAVSALSSGYRSALERTYEVAPATLEAEWLDWLPGYLDGGYRLSAIAAYDLSFVRELVGRGNYAAAAEELRGALAWIERQADAQPAAVAEEARALLERSERGMRAEQIAESARQAIEQADYVRAEQLVADAQSLYGGLGDERQASVLAIYAERAARGQQATARLAEADALARALRYPQARAAADSAAAEFAALGDSVRRDNALSLRAGLDQRQRLAGLRLLVAGAGGVVFSLIGRIFARPAEVW
jgi:Arc/MetJ-type ribon-helix-helix transcriptional regulator